jgi:uncharacterized protein (DUF736 family)
VAGAFRIFAGATEFGAAWKERSATGNDYLGQARRPKLPCSDLCERG